MVSKKTLEINPRHPIIASLKAKALADEAAIDADTRDIAGILYDSALLNSGFPIDDSKDFASRLVRFMKTGLALDSLSLLPEIAVPADEPAAASGEGDDAEDGESEGGDDEGDEAGEAEL